MLCSNGSDLLARVWNEQTGENLLTLRLPVQVNRTVFSPDGRHIATGAGQPGSEATQGAVQVWDRVFQCAMSLKKECDSNAG